MAPAAALELGYAAVTYEGPGQGLTLHRDGLVFRPDWEVVASAALGYASFYAFLRYFGVRYWLASSLAIVFALNGYITSRWLVGNWRSGRQEVRAKVSGPGCIWAAPWVIGIDCSGTFRDDREPVQRGYADGNRRSCQPGHHAAALHAHPVAC